MAKEVAQKRRGKESRIVVEVRIIQPEAKREVTSKQDSSLELDPQNPDYAIERFRAYDQQKTAERLGNYRP